MSQETEIAQTILEGFNRHYRLFRETGASAKGWFEGGEWAAGLRASTARIHFYDARVAEAVAVLLKRFPEASQDENVWAKVKLIYITLLYDHLQPECAETFYNSVATRMLHRRYYRNAYVFRRPVISTEHLQGAEQTYRCYYPRSPAELGSTFRQMLADFQLSCPWQDLDRDIASVERELGPLFPEGISVESNFQVQVLASLFYRNKAAYLVGRTMNGGTQTPFVIPILRNEDGTIYLDAILTRPEHIGRIFSLARVYFMVDMEVPAAYVTFLQEIMPTKRRAELYTVVGLQKQGKTLFFRDLEQHLAHSTDSFSIAPGTKGMVMVVFTLPSFPYVFKVIRDWFAPPKDTSAAEVRRRYLMVKDADRVGRLSDTLEYSNVALPRERFSTALVEELQRLAPSRMEITETQIIIQHMWIERRMVPLDIYIRDAGEDELEYAMREFGNAIKEMASANIFAGDLLLKNFGMTRYGRVVFYDYDELGPLTDCQFRRLPSPPHDEDDTRSSDWFSVGVNDVFPEQFPTFLAPPGPPRELFLKYHADLADPAWWIGAQDRCRAGSFPDMFPYPESMRFRNHRAGLASAA
jgi:isocitrate dehydrogenase kinase/phosphatase